MVPDVAGGSELAYELNGWRDDIVVAHDPGALHARPRRAAGPAGRGRRGRSRRFVAAEGTADEIAAARDAGVPVWLVVDVGRRLPARLFAVLVDRAAAAAGPAPAHGRGRPPVEVVATAAAERVVEPRRIDCPAPPELLRRAGSAW